MRRRLGCHRGRRRRTHHHPNRIRIRRNETDAADQEETPTRRARTFEDPWTDDSAQALELELVDGELWICGRSLTCVVADPATGKVVRDVSIAYPEGELSDLVTGEGSLWAAVAVGSDAGGDATEGRSSAFIRVDPATGAVLGPLHEAGYPVPILAVGDGAAYLVASANESRFERELVRIDLG